MRKSIWTSRLSRAALAVASAAALCVAAARAERMQLDNVALASYGGGVFSYDSSNPMLRGTVRAEYVSSVEFDSAMLSRITFSNGQSALVRMLSYGGGMFRYETQDGRRDEKARDSVRRIDFHVERPAADAPDGGADGLKVIRGASLEKVMLFPDEYAGRRFLFEKCRIGTLPVKASGHWLLAVTTPSGKTVPAVFSDGNPFAFRVTPGMARQIAQFADKAPRLNDCEVVCTIRPCAGLSAENMYAAMVEAIEFAAPGGTGRRTLKAGADDGVLYRPCLCFRVPSMAALTVRKVFPALNAPVGGAPLKAGDVITAISADGQSSFRRLKDIPTFAAFSGLLNGRLGDTVRFKVRRQGKGSEDEVVYRRDFLVLVPAP